MNDQPEVDWVESRHRPAPSSDTPSDERHPGYPHQPGEPLTLDLTVDLARPAPSPVPEASGRGEVVQPTMHILRRADGEEMGEFAFWATDGPDGWDMAEDNDHDEGTVYEILACYPVARRKILWSTLCETCDGEGDGCPACAGSGECEPPDAEHMPIIARPAPSSSPVGDRGLELAGWLATCAADTLAYIEAGHRISHAEPVGDRCLTDCTEAWYVERDTLRAAIADVRALLAAADREEPT
jgi:hypothetical protein